MLVKQLFDTAEQYPQQLALRCGEQSWTWSALAAQVQDLAGGLAAAGIHAGDHVVLWMTNSPAFIVSYYAVLLRGAVVVPLNPALQRGDVPQFTMPLKAVLTTQTSQAACRQALQLDDNSEVACFVCRRPELADDWENLPSHAIEAEFPPAHAPAILHFSSGSTGTPKPLYRTHGQCFAELQHFRATCYVTVQDRIFCAVPLFHAHGMANALWAAVGSGAALILMPKSQPFSLYSAHALQCLAQEKITLFPAVPLMLQALVDSKATADLSQLRLCFSAGSALSTETFEAFQRKFAVSIHQLYGCTEAGSISIDLTEPAVGGSCAGQAMQGVQLKICDEQWDSVASGVVGDIAIQSPALATGYADDTLVNNFGDWFLTGDRGYLDQAGRLFLVGRKAFMIVVAGNKVDSYEVEASLMKHPQVLEAAVIGVPDAASGQAIKAFVVTRSPCDQATLLQYCQTQLPAFKRPKSIEFVAALPKNALGKVLKTQLS